MIGSSGVRKKNFVEQLINSLATILAGLFGGIFVSRSTRDVRLQDRIAVIFASILSGYYIGYPSALFLIHQFPFLASESFAVFGATGFISAGLIPAIHATVISILRAIKENPKSWVELIGKIIGQLKSGFRNPFNRRSRKHPYTKGRNYEPPPD